MIIHSSNARAKCSTLLPSLRGGYRACLEDTSDRAEVKSNKRTRGRRILGLSYANNNHNNGFAYHIELPGGLIPLTLRSTTPWRAHRKRDLLPWSRGRAQCRVNTSLPPLSRSIDKRDERQKTRSTARSLVRGMFVPIRSLSSPFPPLSSIRQLYSWYMVHISQRLCLRYTLSCLKFRRRLSHVDFPLMKVPFQTILSLIATGFLNMCVSMCILFSLRKFH